MSISTPSLSQKAEDLTFTQLSLMKKSLAISDTPFHPDVTYILYNAVSGSGNYLHIYDAGAAVYKIDTGEGGVYLEYSDTGGTKDLTFAASGYKLITIIGDFNGIDLTSNTTTVTQSMRDKYIEVYAGSNHVTALQSNAYYLASNLKTAMFPNITTSGVNSFMGCANLINTCFLSLTAISASMFRNCTKIAEITFKTISGGIGDNAFYGCEKLITFNHGGNATLTLIGVNSFENCYSLKYINLNNVTSISTNAFKLCFNLESVQCKCVSIGSGAFHSCYALSSVVIFKNTSSIGVNAFLDCPIRNFEIQYNASLSIGASAFGGSFSPAMIKDLYINNATNLTNAQATETKITTAGATLLTNYRLLY